MEKQFIELDEEELIVMILVRRPNLLHKKIEITERNLDSEGGIKIYFKVKKT